MYTPMTHYTSTNGIEKVPVTKSYSGSLGHVAVPAARHSDPGHPAVTRDDWREGVVITCEWTSALTYQHTSGAQVPLVLLGKSVGNVTEYTGANTSTLDCNIQDLKEPYTYYFNGHESRLVHITSWPHYSTAANYFNLSTSDHASRS